MAKQATFKPFQMIVAAAALAALASITNDARSAEGASGGGAPLGLADKGERQPDPLWVPREFLLDGMGKMLQALNALIETVPRYSLPRIDENGDIILRRKRPDGANPRPPELDRRDNRAI